ncbi:MAG: hypothetical protein HY300_16910 [Verrucomicrobia bacterium]|nr:hypothetical protein [Verrucomicrobiota bacterium]
MNEPKPKRPLGWLGIAVGLLLLVVICFTNAMCHPRARLMREVRQIKRGDTHAAVDSRMKAIGASVRSYGFEKPEPARIAAFIVASRRPDPWHFFCPEFPFIELGRRLNFNSFTLSHPEAVVVGVKFEDGKAMSFSTGPTETPFPP